MKSKDLVLCMAVLLGSGWAASAQAQAPRACDEAELTRLAAQPGRVAFDGGRLSLVPPPGVRVLTAAERERRPAGEKGDVILADSAGTSIALWRSDGGMPSQRIVEGVAIFLEVEAAGTGEFRWIRRGHQVSLGGARWWLLEFEYQGEQGPEHVWSYITGYRGRGLAVRIVTPVRGPGRRPTADSIRTLRLHDCALPGDEEGPLSLTQ